MDWERPRPGYKLIQSYFTWKVPAPISSENRSPLFSSKKMKDIEWQMIISDDLDFISVVCYNSMEEDIPLIEPFLLQMSIKNGTGQEIKRTMYPASDSWHCVVEFPLSENVQSEFQQQNDGSFTISVEIYAYVRKFPVCVSQSSIDSSEELVTNLEGLFENMKLSDVIFNIDGRLFPAHKAILAARSEVFDAMFQPSKENSSNQVKIEDIDPDVFHELLRFIYTGRVTVDKMESMADELLNAADKYLVEGLKKKWENYLSLHLTPVKCLEILLQGDLDSPNPTELLNKAVNFFERYPEQVMATEEWEKARRNNRILLYEIQEFVCRRKETDE